MAANSVNLVFVKWLSFISIDQLFLNSAFTMIHQKESVIIHFCCRLMITLDTFETCNQFEYKAKEDEDRMSQLNGNG